MTKEYSIQKTNGDIVRFSTLSGGKCNNETFFRDLHWQGLSESEIASLSIQANEIDMDWGAQFTIFPNLHEISLAAQKTIRLNCFNFSESTIRNVKLIANELWFNDGAFAGAKSLEYVTCNGIILDGPHGPHGALTEMLFQNCSNLKAVHGTYRGTSTMSLVFQGCFNLEVPLDLYVKYLGFGTFINCSSLKYIHLHNGLVSLGSSTFKNCISLEDVYVPDTVTSLGGEAFSGCSKLKRIHLPKNLYSIPSATFAECVSLEKVFLSDTITRIEAEAFKGCSSLYRPWFPEKLQAIGKNAFRGCVSLGEIFLPVSVSDIGEDAFADCGNLIIRCIAGSYAEQYARDNHITFISQIVEA